eukprot:scaffold42007_cov75-Phaeocystis_antarctica.AAC.2
MVALGHGPNTRTRTHAFRRPPNGSGAARGTRTHTQYTLWCHVSAGGIGKASPPAMPSLARSSRRGCARGEHGPTHGMPPGAFVKEEETVSRPAARPDF